MAVKTLKNEDEGALNDLINEIGVMKTMHHPNLVQVRRVELNHLIDLDSNGRQGIIDVRRVLHVHIAVLVLISIDFVAGFWNRLQHRNAHDGPRVLGQGRPQKSAP